MFVPECHDLFRFRVHPILVLKCQHMGREKSKRCLSYSRYLIPNQRCRR